MTSQMKSTQQILKTDPARPQCYGRVVKELGKNWIYLDEKNQVSGFYWTELWKQWQRSLETQEWRDFFMEEDIVNVVTPKGKLFMKWQTELFFPFGDKAIVLLGWTHEWGSWQQTDIAFAVSDRTIKAMDAASDWGALDKK